MIRAPGRRVIFPSRRRVVAQIAQETITGLESGRGALTVIVGSRGSGRSSVLEGVVSDVRASRPRTTVLTHRRRVLATQIHFWASDVPKYADAAGTGAQWAGKGATLAGRPELHAVAQTAGGLLKGTGKAIQYWLDRAVPDVHDAASFFAQVRSMDRTSGCVGMIDDIDAPDAEVWYTHLAAYVHGNLPRAGALIVSVEAEDDAVALDFASRARMWQEQGRPVRIVELADLCHEDLQALTGRCDPDVLTSLAERGQGNARLTDAAWSGWRRSGHVRRSATLQWRLTDGGVTPPPPAEDRLWVSFAERGLELDERERCRALLAAAALQGEVFVIGPAAASVGLEEVDAVRMLEVLAGEPEDGGPLAPPLEVSTSGVLTDPSLSAFADIELWQHLASPGPSKAAGVARAQATALLGFLGPSATDNFALVFRNLYRHAGDRSQTLAWQHRLESQVSREALSAMLAATRTLDSAVGADEECRRAAYSLLAGPIRLSEAGGDDLELDQAVRRRAIALANRTSDFDLIMTAYTALSGMLIAQGHNADDVANLRGLVDVLTAKRAGLKRQLEARLMLAQAMQLSGQDPLPLLRNVQTQAADADLVDAEVTAIALTADLGPRAEAWEMLESLWDDVDLREQLDVRAVAALSGSLIRVANAHKDAPLLRQVLGWRDRRMGTRNGSHDKYAKALLWEDDPEGALGELLLFLGASPGTLDTSSVAGAHWLLGDALRALGADEELIVRADALRFASTEHDRGRAAHRTKLAMLVRVKSESDDDARARLEFATQEWRRDFGRAEGTELIRLALTHK